MAPSCPLWVQVRPGERRRAFKDEGIPPSSQTLADKCLEWVDSSGSVMVARERQPEAKSAEQAPVPLAAFQFLSM
jgi:hypothetical protein